MKHGDLFSFDTCPIIRCAFWSLSTLKMIKMLVVGIGIKKLSIADFKRSYVLKKTWY